MPRKQKDVYERIKETEAKITSLEYQLKEQKDKLNILNKEREELEMRNVFSVAKEKNMSYNEILKAVNMFSKQKVKE